MEGWVDGWSVGWLVGWLDGWMNWWMDRWMYGWEKMVGRLWGIRLIIGLIDGLMDRAIGSCGKWHLSENLLFALFALTKKSFPLKTWSQVFFLFSWQPVWGGQNRLGPSRHYLMQYTRSWLSSPPLCCLQLPDQQHLKEIWDRNHDPSSTHVHDYTICEGQCRHFNVFSFCRSKVSIY